jgi:hypothetical protein
MRKKGGAPGRGKRATALPAVKQPPPTTTAFTGTKRVLSTDERRPSPNESTLRQPDERDESADQQGTAPRDVMKQAHDDVQSGQQDTDCRNRVAEVLPGTPKTPQNFSEADEADGARRVEKNTSRPQR